MQARKITLIEIGAGGLPVVTPAPVVQSSWFPVIYSPPGTPPMEGVVPSPVADGVLIEWDAVDQEGVIYIIERGPAADGPWTEVHRTTETRYLYSDGSGQVWWFRITATVRGQTGDSSIVEGQPGRVPNYAEMEALNNALIQEILDRQAGDAASVNQALGEAREYTDAQVAALNGIVKDIVGADQWNVIDTYPSGDFVRHQGMMYRALVENSSVEPGTDAAKWQKIGDYTSVGDALAASISMATQNASDIRAEATRIDAVATRMPVGTGGLATAASVSSLSQSTTDSFSAMGQRVGSVESKVPADGGRAASAAQVSTVDQARSSGDIALGQRIDATNAALSGKASSDALNLLKAQVQNTDGRVDANATAVAQVRAQQTGGGNMLRNSDFGMGAVGWNFATNPWAVVLQKDYAGADWVPAGGAQLGFSAGGIPANGVALDHDVWPSAMPGENWIFSAYLACHRCVSYIQLIAYDVAANVIGFTSSDVAQSFGGKALKDWRRVSAWFPNGTPEGTVRVMARWWTHNASGDNPFSWITQPMLEKGAPGQTQPSPWSVGAAGVSAVTQMLEARATTLENGQTRLFAKAGVMLDVNGRVIGWSANNDGRQGIFDVVADRFNVTDPNGTGSTTFEAGRWVTRSGGYMQVHGKPFGTTGDLMMYIGVGSDPNAASKGNGIFWIDNKGNAYFGGSLSAGILRNAVQTNTTQMIGTELLNGPFRTNGGNRTVTLSFARTHRRQRSAIGSTGFVAGAGSNTAQVQLFRQIGTGSWVLWQVLNTTGSVDISNEPDGPDIAISGWGGSLTVNDNSSALETVSYRAVISAATEQGVTHQSGNFDSQTITQNLSIISVEQ
ncbi:hypothetical protein [Stenotrophomonas sp.]|uniref:hypothetical protein n=1 Tax=Stenotrophomonas sp. TaxID=69392 RepID=UPI002898E082|nr:hypothetical protein [Stenotrophomonas sp.]